MLSLTPVLLLWLSLIWTSDPSAALKNLPPFTTIWLIIPRTFSHSTKPGCNPPILTISFPHWYLLAFPFWTLLVLLVMVVVLLSFIYHSSKSNHSVLETFLLLSLLNSWQLNLLLATQKLSFLISIYRLPSSKISTFFDEFQNLLEFFVPSPSELIITGDFNIHTDSDLTTSNKFSCILDNFHLKQHIHFPSHDDGHTLDLLITRTSSDIITHLSHHESYQSDHKSFTFKFFSHIRPTTQRSVIHYRSFKTIDIDNFKSDILSSPLYTNPASNSSDLSEQLSSTLNSILDIHAPLKSKIVVLRPHTPWTNPEILVAKRERSRLERSWRRWKSPFDRKKFRARCNFVRSLISKAKSNFLTNLVTESSSNPRTLWKTLNSILHRNPSNSSPDTPDTQSLANSFLQFFSDKIERIRSKFSPSDSPDPFLFPIIPPPNLSNFNPSTFSEIRNLIFSSQNKQCELDSIPTFLLKLCFDELGPTIINIINFSLSEGISFHLHSNKQSFILYSKNLLFLMMISAILSSYF